MSVVKMMRVQITALQKNRKAVLELLQRRGVVEITAAEPDESGLFAREDTSQQVETFSALSREAGQALEVLDKLVPPKKSLLASFKANPVRDLSDYYDFYGVSAKFSEIVKLILRLDTAAAEAAAERVRIGDRITALEPWSGFDLPLHPRNDGAFIGILPGVLTVETARELLDAADGEFGSYHLEIIGPVQGDTAVFFLTHKERRERAEAMLRACGFAYPAVETNEPPAVTIAALREQEKAKEREREEALRQICEMSASRPDIAFAQDYYEMRAEKYRVKGELLQGKHAFVLSGWLPEPAVGKLGAELEKEGAYLEAWEPEEGEETPVLLKNNGFAAPVESVLESYSLPAGGELDPVGIMSIFYYILFGIMFSDAGYGLLMVLGTGLLLLLCRNSPKKDFLKMFFFCGISTTAWGFLLGSFFGDALEVIGKTFFNAQWQTPCLLLSPIKEPMHALVYAMALGLVHLFAGLICGIVNAVRRKDGLSAVADYLSWLLLVASLVVVLMGTSIFTSISQMTVTLPAWLNTGALIVAGLSALAILIFAGRESRNPFKRLAKGLYGLYGITGYLGDVLSYSRLLALGLATGVIAQVINMMGVSLGNTPAGVIMFVIVFLVGHLLNFAINVLGAYVHTNRLQYVEFFGKFYEGGGRKFEPFKIKNKHYDFKEENQNG